MLKHLVTSEWLTQHIEDAKVKILDCRFELGNPLAGIEAYLKDHIPNAVYVDLEKDMSSSVKDHGGRHPLPNLEDFIAKLGAIGIDETVTVVAYDDQGGAMASRLWWLLKYLGHEDVFVLDIPYSTWKNKGNRVVASNPLVDKVSFTPRVNESMLCSVEEVSKATNNDQVLLIDSRDRLRYLGIEEPIDKKAGHIPSAVNYFWKDCLSNTGRWQTQAEQEDRFRGIDKNKEIIVYCGSGVTACPNVLSLQSIGYKNVKLYLGSWSDWISYPENKVNK